MLYEVTAKNFLEKLNNIIINKEECSYIGVSDEELVLAGKNQINEEYCKINNIRYDNTKSLNNYCNGNYILNKEVMSKEKNMENEMILGLRKTSGVSTNTFYKKYGVKIEDVFESGRGKNQKLNTTIYKLIKCIEKNGDSTISDFNIILNENNQFVFNVEGTKLQRFLADVYGYTTIEKMKEKDEALLDSTAEDVLNFLSNTLFYESDFFPKVYRNYGCHRYQ